MMGDATVTRDSLLKQLYLKVYFENAEKQFDQC
jgi:hypothetical protein